MNSQWFGYLELLILFGLIYLFFRYMKKRKAARIKILKSNYEKAIASGRKDLALQHGRAYYAALRYGKLSIYDEQAIANDLSAMQSSN